MWTSILGYTLRQKDGTTKRTRECVQGKQVVALYFSAQKNFQCGKFTPHMASLYTNVYKGKGMEVVLVSKDTTEADYLASCGEMPWLALPYSEQTVKEKVMTLCRVEELPAFVLLNQQGEVYKYDALKVINDPDTYPWMPRQLPELLEKTYWGPGPKLPSLDMSVLYGKFVGLYFTSQRFTEYDEFNTAFSETYKKIKLRNPNKFECVYMTDDLDEHQFREHFKNMPWIAYPFGDREAIERLREIFNVRDIPAILILDRDLKTVINQNAIDRIAKDRDGFDCPWKIDQAVHPFADQSLGTLVPIKWDKPEETSVTPVPVKEDSDSSSSDSDSSSSGNVIKRPNINMEEKKFYSPPRQRRRY